MSTFTAISLAIATAAVFGFVARILRQPLLIGYLFAGLVLALLGLFGQQKLILEDLAQIGVALLLFLVGLEMNVRQIPQIGKAAIFAGAGQMILTFLFGFGLARALGFETLSAVYIAIALTFSSTIVVVKLLSEKKDLDSLYGKIAVAILLLQDVVAIVILMFLSGFEVAEIQALTFFWALVRGLLLLFGVYLASRYFLGRLFDKIAATSLELLFMASLGWAFLLSTVASLPQVGFSAEIGGFLAGLSLANSVEQREISAKIRPLRDFFVTLFFLLIGAKMAIGAAPGLLLPALILTLFVLFGKPLIFFPIMGFLGYTKRTSFLAGASLAQISEFSLILAALGEKIGHIESQVSTLITWVGAGTFVASTYIIGQNHRLYPGLSRYLGIFERKKTHEAAFLPQEKFSDHILLFGCDRTGRSLLPALGRKKEPLVILDFNPVVVEKLIAEGRHAFYGDAVDKEILDSLGLSRSRLVVSTLNSLEDDLTLIGEVKSLKNPPVAIFIASSPHNALALYEAGADYVVVPQVAAGENIAHLLSGEIDKKQLSSLREKHFDRLAKERF